MKNPMLEMLGQNQMTPIKNLLNQLKAIRNPNAFMQNLIAQNPQLKNVMDYVNANGGNPKDAFYKMAEEKGVNPDEILSQLQS